jgi:hypothetical protein
MNPDIKDIKPPIDIPSDFLWLWIALGVLILAALIGWLIFLFVKRPKLEEKIEVLSPLEKAYARLENLRLKNLINRPYLKPFYSELSDIIRLYMEERFFLKAPEMTTEEFLDSLRRLPVLNDDQKEILKEFLHTCDMVKFAKHQPNVSEAQKSFDLVKSFIGQTHGI